MGFYDTGQLFLEDYYTLALVVRGGIGTPHLDGNTRLCTATADFALKETFGTDGAPGSLTDFDECDTIFAVGHNIAETHTVLWMRILDRLQGPDRPRLVVVDPRRTKVAQEADVHLPIRSGTNMALLNGIQHELIAKGWVDQGFVDAPTVGFEKLQQNVMQYPPERVAEICGVPADEIPAAAEIIGTARRLVSTCLQGVYQSHQATASATQVNNVNLLRGMIGKLGCTVFQMNGQPTAQNTLHRIRSILKQERLFVAVSDAFLTETAQLADVVLPAALWGEKTGTYTNHDRTVHPPIGPSSRRGRRDPTWRSSSTTRRGSGSRTRTERRSSSRGRPRSASTPSRR